MDYLTFFGFVDAPFRLAPDPQYFFPSYSHQEALQTLLYSVRAGEGFIQITGDPGTGKTLLLRTMLKELGADVQTALILNPNLSPQDLLRVILDDFALTNNDEDIFSRPKDQLIRIFRDFLLAKAEEGCKAVIIVDEAQNLPLETIEELRLLSNLETDKQKLLQIFLMGQRELEQKIEDPGLRQLSQRITIRYVLTPFSQEETATYINHRLKIAAPDNKITFSHEIINKVYHFSQGTPRLINIVCERCLMAAYVDEKKAINLNHFNSAVRSIKGETPTPIREQSDSILSGKFMWWGFLLICLVSALFWGWRNPQFRTFVNDLLESSAIKSSAPKPKSLPSRFKVKKAIPLDPGAAVASLPTKKVIVTPVKLPPTVLNLSPGFPLLLARGKNLEAELWIKKNADSEAEIIDHLQLPPGSEPGLWLAGVKDGLPFLFNPVSFPFHQPPSLPKTWRQFFRSFRQPIIPLVIIPDSAANRSLEMAEEQTGAQLQQFFQNWATAWRQLNLDELMSFYGPIMTFYKQDSFQSFSVDKNKLRRLKKKLFQETVNLKLEFSAPVCLLDPTDANLAMLFFYQDYHSDNYQDKGYKALFLSRSRISGIQEQWRIVAKFFIPIK